MASVFKLRMTRYVDATGKRVKRETPGARKVQERSKKWYGEYRDEDNFLRRVPLAVDRTAALTMLADLVRKAERRKSGLSDPIEDQVNRPIAEHIREYTAYLAAKGGTETHVAQTTARIERLVEGCGFRRVNEIEAPKVANWLAEQRRTKTRFSNQTSNFYRDSVVYFCNWLVRHNRLDRNPVSALDRINVDVDRRHDRRALSDDEFRRLVSAALGGRDVEGMTGPDRAMLYVLSAWTGFRRAELAALTRRSLDLDGEIPTLRLEAKRSKRRRVDELPLHPYVVNELRTWLESKSTNPQEPLFSLRTRKGWLRDTAAMMREDLEVARNLWLKEAQSPEEKERREESDFLKYKDGNGLFADFHANRHTFISNLSRSGVALAIAQKLARHSDPRLTANRYTHVELQDKAAAMQTLPTPATRDRATKPSDVGTDGEMVASEVAGETDPDRLATALPVNECTTTPPEGEKQKPLPHKEFGNGCRDSAVIVGVHPAGFEPATFGSVDRCSIQLS